MKAWKHLRLDASNPAFLTLWLDVENRRLNVLSSDVFRELQCVVDRVIDMNLRTPIVVRSAKEKGFVVGADLREISQIRSDKEIQEFLGLGQRVLDCWEQLPNLTVAWIQGPCLGGGLELAMACRIRLVSESDSTQLGMPEAKLGLTPGWGGTQRLPHLVGLSHAVEMLMTGEAIGSRRACELGLADGTWSELNQEQDLMDWLTRLTPSEPKIRTKVDETGNWPQQWIDCQAQVQGFLSDKGLQEFPTAEARQAIAHALEVGILVSRSEGLRCERENFFALLERPQVQAMLQRFAPRDSSART